MQIGENVEYQQFFVNVFSRATLEQIKEGGNYIHVTRANQKS